MSQYARAAAVGSSGSIAAGRPVATLSGASGMRRDPIEAMGFKNAISAGPDPFYYGDQRSDAGTDEDRRGRGRERREQPQYRFNTTLAGMIQLQEAHGQGEGVGAGGGSFAAFISRGISAYEASIVTVAGGHQRGGAMNYNL